MEVFTNYSMNPACSEFESLERLDQLMRQQNCIKKAYDDYRTLYCLSRQLNETKDIGEILERLLSIVAEIVNFSACALFLKESLSDDFYLYEQCRLDARLLKELDIVERQGFLHWVCQENRITILPDMNEGLGNLSLLLIPLSSGKKTMGVLAVFVELWYDRLTPAQNDLLSLLGSQAAMAIENAKLYQDMALQHRVLSSMKNFLTNIMESMADALWAVDSSNKIILFNQQTEKLFGITQVEAMGNDYHQLFPKSFCDFLDKLLGKVFHSSRAVEEEFEYVREAEKVIPLSVQLSLLQDKHNSDSGVIIVCRDVSERNELVNLRRIDQLKDEFLSAVSHELRTPLTAIKSFTEILLNYSDNDPKAQKEFLSIIDRETDRLVELINDLLDISKIEQEGFSMNMEIIKLDEIVTQSVTAVQALAKEKDIEITSELCSDLNQVVADKHRLVQVFINILGNGIKFSPEHSTIRIFTEKSVGHRKNDTGDYVRVGIADQGIGIPEEMQRIIFQKFKQVADHHKERPQGTGLGLAICKRIIEQFGGEIWVESEVGKGSTFYFTIPLAK